jgi:hypothetical protein
LDSIEGFELLFKVIIISKLVCLSLDMLRSRLSKSTAVHSVPLLKSYWGGTEPLKLIPYGISSWKYMKENKKFYVDKTCNIRSLEKSGPFNKIQRPRRFGKTLFCDQVHLYYDIAKEPHVSQLLLFR